MPQGPLELCHDLLTEVKTSGHASETVLECLASHVPISEPQCLHFASQRNRMALQSKA